jgi:hypothetical protein
MPKEFGPYTVKEELKTYQTKYAGLWVGVKYKAHNEDFSCILWPERWSAESLKEVKEDYTARGLPEQYSQEYLNIPVDPVTPKDKAILNTLDGEDEDEEDIAETDLMMERFQRLANIKLND